MPLEPWQKFRKTTPCEICRGWNTGKGENKCKGFRHRDGTGSYCQQVQSPDELDVHGLKLFWHGNLYEAAGNAPEGEGVALDDSVALSPSETFIREVTQLYPETKNWKGVTPEHQKVWYAVMRGNVEITRSLRKEVAERYLSFGKVVH